jgi:3-oxoisoapionate kinase
MNDLLISFYGDDFTGSTDAMESLARSGVRTVLFTQPPTPQKLAQHPGIRAFGVAGTTRSMSPDQMDRALRPGFQAMLACGAPIVHYKVCSTFDSSPTIGSIGRVIDVGTDVFQIRFVPVVVGAPSLGRHTVFGNLFARSGAESEPYRLDRHPSMTKHPTTPMSEADLTAHLAKQTSKPIGLFDVLKLEQPNVAELFGAFVERQAVGFIDLLYERQLATVGSLLDGCRKPLFVVGSSGVESALCAHWMQIGRIDKPSDFRPPGPANPILAICGSCSPVTAAQIEWAARNGFVEFAMDVQQSDDTHCRLGAVNALHQGRSVVIHTRGSSAVSSIPASVLGPRLGEIGRHLLNETGVRRVIVAGGDTSGQIARELEIESLEMVAELTSGAPLCRAAAPGSPADGIEITFKGGQIGPQDFFGMVQRGH